jgi:hypothetical protein
MRVAIIVSVVVHAGVIVFAPTAAPPPPPKTASRTTVEIVPPPPPPPKVVPETAPIDVQYFDLGRVKIAAIDPATLAPPDQGKRIAVTVGGGNEKGLHKDKETGVGTPHERSPLMVMRKEPDKKIIVGMSQKFLDDFMKRSKPVEIPDLPGARLDAQIADLQSRMRSHRDNDYYDLSGDRAALAALKAERDAVELKQQKDGTYVTEKETFRAKVERDGTVALSDKPNLSRQGLGAKFDVTDAVMRSQGMDPYAREKLKFLDRTRDQRVAIGKEYRKEVLSKSAEIMRRNLDRMWVIMKTTAARKQALFDLWDEVAETGDPELVAGGVEARALLLRFAQVKLAGADAFTPEEVARFNQKRTSKAVFAP